MLSSKRYAYAALSLLVAAYVFTPNLDGSGRLLSIEDTDGAYRMLKEGADTTDEMYRDIPKKAKTRENARTLQTSATTKDCHLINFSADGNGEPLVAGTYVSQEWRNQVSMTIHAVPKSGTGYAPNSMARIFDSTQPGPSDHLGSPNKDCPGSGPGAGIGGRPGKKGENCEPLGNLLIIQDSDIATPDDNKRGGQIIFMFHDPVTINHIGLIDNEKIDGPKRITITTSDHEKHQIEYSGEGHNAYSVVPIEIDNIVNIVVNFAGAGGVSEISVCDIPGKPAIATALPTPTEPPVEVSTGVSRRTDAVDQCMPTRIVYEEDFEDKNGVEFDPDASGWTNVKIDAEGEFTQFLGRFAREDYRKYPMKYFDVYGFPTHVVVELDLYEIDNWVDPDCFYIVIGTDKVTFGAYFQTDNDEGTRTGTSSGGINWEVTSTTEPKMIGFNPEYKDQIHHLKATLNPSDYADGEFFLRFETILNSFTSNRASGFDNFKIVAYYDCPVTPAPIVPVTSAPVVPVTSAPVAPAPVTSAPVHTSGTPAPVVGTPGSPFDGRNGGGGGVNGDPLIMGLSGQVFKFEGRSGSWYSAVSTKSFQWNMKIQQYEGCPSKADTFVNGVGLTVFDDHGEAAHRVEVSVVNDFFVDVGCGGGTGGKSCLGRGSLELVVDGVKYMSPRDHKFSDGTGRVIAYNTFFECSRKWYDFQVDETAEISSLRRARNLKDPSVFEVLDTLKDTMIDKRSCDDWLHKRKENDDLFEQPGHWSTILVKTDKISLHIEYKQESNRCKAHDLDVWVSAVAPEVVEEEWEGIIGETKSLSYRPNGKMKQLDRNVALKHSDDVAYEVISPFSTKCKACVPRI